MTTTSTVTGGYSDTSSRYSFDSAALVEVAVNAKLAKADTYETQITTNESKISAYEEMQSLLLTLQESMQALRSPTGTLDSSDDVFLDRAAYLTSSSTTTATTLLEATVDEGTDIGSYSLVVDQIATANKVGCASTVSSRTEGLDLSGTFTLGTSAGGSADITITEDMSLDDIAEAIDALTDTTGVDASVIKVSSTSYMLVLTATETNETITMTDADDVLGEDGLGLLDSEGAVANELQAAQGAIIEIDGVTIERDSNEIDDAIDGVTLHLYAADEDTTVTLEVANDLSTIKEQIEAFVEAYNAFREFVSTNQGVASDGTKADDAVLFGDNVLRSISSTVADIISDSSGGYSLADIGLSLDSSNELVLDEDTLDNAIVDDLDMVKALLTFECTTSDNDLRVLSHEEVTDSLSFTLDIAVDDDGTITAASVGGDATLFTISGTRIIGAEGTAYEGLTLFYSGSEDASINVEINQGLADQLYSAIETVADEYDGTLADTIDNLEESNADLEERVTRIEEQASDLETYLSAKYASVEAKLAEAESVLALLEAMNDSDD